MERGFFRPRSISGKIMMKTKINLIAAAAVYFLIFQVGCAPQTIKNAADENNACGLISNRDIEAAQGETVKAANNSFRNDGALLVSQCFYELPTYSKSVSVEVTRSSKGKSEVREIWEKKFNPANAAKDEDEDREETEQNGGEKQTAARMQPVPNLGEAAFRVGNRISNALYVRQNDAIIRISIGGADDDNAKLEKLKNLARKALAKIQ